MCHPWPPVIDPKGSRRRRLLAQGRAARGSAAESLRRAQGDALISPRITRRLIAEFAARRDPHQPPEALRQLTDRERGVLPLVAQGLSNDEIAGRLVISPLTAKTNVRNVLGKLGCRDRAGLVALAYESGLIAPGASNAGL
jgi:DNA-binding NarL/FixJ family response regulator